jgi:hypothetical protein
MHTGGAVPFVQSRAFKERAYEMKKSNSKIANNQVHELNIMDGSGHTAVQWGTDQKELELARQLFGKHVDMGYMAYAVKDGGGENVLIHEFDETAEKIIMTPRMAGG